MLDRKNSRPNKIFAGGCEMGAVMRAFDWSTPRRADQPAAITTDRSQ